MTKIVKDVVGALIERDGRFLVARRNTDDRFGGLWEFPGGKVEDGETKKAALEREIREELGLGIKAGALLFVCSDEIPDLKINVYLYECRIITGIPQAIDCQDVKWANSAELKDLELAPADEKILKWLENR